MKIPKQVISMLGDEIRSQLLSGCSNEESLRELLVSAEPKDIKERVMVALEGVYAQHGYNAFMAAIEHLKTFRNRDVQDIIQAKGEVAEAVLVIMLKEFIKVRGHSDWKIYKGLMLGTLNNSTELDILLCTPHIVCVLEVKSYSGAKTIKDKCYLSAKREMDVWSQNAHHIRYFWATFRNCCKAPDGAGAIKSALFSFSAGTLEDVREDKWKKLMPVLEVETLVKFLVTVEKLNTPKWDLNALQFCVGLVAQNAPTMEQHIAYLRRGRGR